MNLYRTNPSSSFLDILADFILDNFSGKNSIDNLKIILPSGLACWKLQNILINKQNITILPNIIPLSNIMAEGEEIFAIASENLQPITLLQEKIILAEIIHNYRNLQFSITQSLQFCSTIAELFYQLACNNLSIDSVNEIEKISLSQHWSIIYQFLKYTHSEWQKKIELLGLLDRVNYQITMMDAEIARLKRAGTSLIVAGIVGDNPILWNFLNNVANSLDGFIILPPISNLSDSLDNPEEDCLYNFKKLLTILNKNLSDFQPLDSHQSDNLIFNKIIFEDIANPTNITPNMTEIVLPNRHCEECVSTTKQSREVVRNGLLRRLTPSRNDDNLLWTNTNQGSYIADESQQLAVDHIKYFELEDIFQEAEQISLICQQYSDKKIAIIINNQTTKNFYCNFLTKYSLEFQDLLGDNLSETLISSLIISISEILCNDFDIKKLFLLLKNPLINCKLVQRLELLMNGKNRFVRQSDQMLSLVEKTNDSELIEWCKKLIDLLYTSSGNSFAKILKSSISIAEKLYRDIWHEQPAVELSNFLSELIKTNCNLTLDNKKDFPRLLKGLMSSCKYFAHQNYSKNIIIGKVEDLMLLKFDLVILTDFNQGCWSSSSSISQWINEQTLKKLHMVTSSSIDQYYFYLFLHNAQVIITRAKRQDGKSGLLPSNLLLKLQFILQQSLIPENYLTYLAESDLVDVQNNVNINMVESINHNGCVYSNDLENWNVKQGVSERSVQLVREYANTPQFCGANSSKHSSIYSPIFPEVISVTDIEMLVRNPYSFYAKKILNVRSKDMIGQEPKISEFGSFVHKVLEQYSRNYNKLENNKVGLILDISNNILQNTILPTYTQKIWQIKFMPIAESFIEFDEQRRNDYKYIYSESRGEILLNIGGQELTIIGVADRIEIDAFGAAVIIDYKTGSLPSRKDVESGLSPQLIIEALMLQEGGFGIEVHSVKQVTYVKISSSKPIIQTLEIDITREELDHHKQGMMRLLEYYITNKSFSYDIDLLKYDDYAHLARRD
ncbi:PD-(D/E)XK nuclease family protein [Candidatus Tisiphia endosymbiont of Hybos culiciformis]|uniref:PD-(D/E)XK nuclease family protein n=1 Tax=Candidatus Tisiphia endosymbiont of Hybos culiciformis TaxID=3139331 RepID=UPI003CCB1DCC